MSNRVGGVAGIVALMYQRWLHELWNGPLDQLEHIALELVTGEFVGSWPNRPGLVHGPDELAAVIRQSRTMFESLRFDVAVGPVVQADLIAARWVASGRYDGAPVEFHGHDLLRHDGERFTEYWVIAEEPH